MPIGIYKHKPHSELTKIKIGVSNSGKNGGNWKGNKVGYFGVHIWLNKHYGKASKCENSECEYETPKRFDWALLQGKKYERNRKNFFMLCRGCHLKYDITDEKRLKVSIAHKGKIPWNKGKKMYTEEWKKKMSKRIMGNNFALGYRHTEEAKRKIGLASRERQLV